MLVFLCAGFAFQKEIVEEIFPNQKIMLPTNVGWPCSRKIWHLPNVSLLPQRSGHMTIQDCPPPPPLKLDSRFASSVDPFAVHQILDTRLLRNIRQVRQTRNVDVRVNADVPSHPLGTSTPQSALSWICKNMIFYQEVLVLCFLTSE